MAAAGVGATEVLVHDVGIVKVAVMGAVPQLVQTVLVTVKPGGT